jgi:hypothetical protein
MVIFSSMLALLFDTPDSWLNRVSMEMRMLVRIQSESTNLQVKSRPVANFNGKSIPFQPLGKNCWNFEGLSRRKRLVGIQ